MKPAFASMLLAAQLLARRAALVGITAVLVGAACAPTRAPRSASPTAAAGSYVFALSEPAPGQRIATALSRHTARALVSGTGEARTDRAAFAASCEQQLIAHSGPQVTKFSVQCKAAPSGATAATSHPTFEGLWTVRDGLQIERSNMGWNEKNDTRPAVLYVSSRALETLFGGVWQPGVTRQVPSSRMLWQLISPELSDVRGDDAPATVQFVGVVENFATFSYRSTLKHDDLVVEISGTAVLDTRTGWPSRLTVQADSAQDMAKVSLKVEKTITTQP